MARHNILGKQGEELAASYLLSKGYRIRHKNWVSEKVEIDIVAEKEDIVVCVEVKTRSTDYFGYPEESVSKAKTENLLNAMDAYLDEFNLDKEVRYDIISIILTSSEEKIYHINFIFNVCLDFLCFLLCFY